MKPGWQWQLAQRLEIRWWQWYLRGRDQANYLSSKRDYWRRLLKTIDRDVPPGSRVLDAGCGPAGVFMVLPQANITAVDPLLTTYADRLTHFQPEAYPWVDFHTSTLEAFTGHSAAFDHVFCFNAINHVDDWERALDRLTDCAAPLARLALGVDVHRHAWLKKVFRRLPGDVLHPHQHDREDYRRALRQRGWRLEREHCWRSGRIFDYWIITAYRTGIIV